MRRKRLGCLPDQDAKVFHLLTSIKSSVKYINYGRKL